MGSLSAELAPNSLVSVTTNVTGSFASLNGTAVTRPWITGGMLLQALLGNWCHQIKFIPELKLVASCSAADKSHDAYFASIKITQTNSDTTYWYRTFR
ncbi:EF-hand calcium-binding domain-containing protein 8 [Tyto alba]|uniref:EF-hand calcium-binding domain-containing protein 8 n=1 Tax=Tyto alba TaxID=56313 RepID=UPI001C66F516|nr:EF-hand calcium-binding domain-containing protein 8 [Tyto alba]